MHERMRLIGCGIVMILAALAGLWLILTDEMVQRTYTSASRLADYDVFVLMPIVWVLIVIALGGLALCILGSSPD